MRVPFNEGWVWRRVGETGPGEPVVLPHDAMLTEPRTAQSAGGNNTGWFAARDYEYSKEFVAPQDVAYLEFEGVYHNAEVFVDDEVAPSHPNGYFGFKVPITGGKHRIRVVAHNAEQPSSRWYSGAGIYRPVSMVTFPEKHILPESVIIRTLDWREPTVRVDVQTTEDAGVVTCEILDGDTVLATQKSSHGMLFSLPGAKLWSVDDPALYICRLKNEKDVQEFRFGIRFVECDAKQGFRVNGVRTLLLGACIHHDNGILGAIEHPFAAKRKIALLKKAGYNAVRSAHNPCSKAILDACDELGMMVLDEYADMWYIHKTPYDYAGFFEKNWQDDLKALVEKDRNHPSVIMYSIGNEVSETSQKRGIELAGRMRDYLHELDDRPVTCGINIFFNFLFSLGLGVYSDEKAAAEAAKAKSDKGKAKKKKAVGSEFINNIAGLLGADFMKFGATLHGSDRKTRDAFARLDVAGYNYGVNRCKKDLKQYPERVILGSETFCSDAVAFYDLAKDNPALIGDFVWTGMDYLGEVGLGAWEYKDYAPIFEHGPGWITSGAGVLDLVGTGSAQLAYTQVAFEMSQVRIGVVPVKWAKQKHSPAAWRMTNAMENWSWDGCEGQKTSVEVYARGNKAELLLNGKSLGKKKIPANKRVKFPAVYEPGELTAVVYDAADREIGRTSLRTAGKQTMLRLLPETERVREGDLLYVRLRYTDEKGNVKPLARGDIHIRVKGGELLALGNACPYNVRGYRTDTTDTYYGEALAIIRPYETIIVEGDSPYGQARIEVPFEQEAAR